MIGSYVTYKGKPFMVAAIRGNLRLITTLRGKLQVSSKKLVSTSLVPAKVVSFEDTDYIVTRKGNIMSTRTNKWMSPNWDKHPQILALA